MLTIDFALNALTRVPELHGRRGEGAVDQGSSSDELAQTWSFSAAERGGRAVAAHKTFVIDVEEVLKKLVGDVFDVVVRYLWRSACKWWRHRAAWVWTSPTLSSIAIEQWVEAGLAAAVSPWP